VHRDREEDDKAPVKFMKVEAEEGEGTEQLFRCKKKMLNDKKTIKYKKSDFYL